MPTLNILSGSYKRRGKSAIALFVLIAICFFGRVAEAQYGGNDTKVSGGTSTYVFLSGQSTVVKTGGIAGVHETYPIQGQFQLTVDANAGVASFDYVDAFLLSPISSSPPQSLGELFNMTELQGTVVNDALIELRGKTADNTNTDIALTLTFTDAAVQLTGQTIPPPNSADFFIFNVDAVAQRKYGGGMGEPNDPYQIWTPEEFVSIAYRREDWGKHFILMSDLDFSGIDSNEVMPIGDEITEFSGIFDGAGHAISNYTCRLEGLPHVGVFGILVAPTPDPNGVVAVVENLHVVSAEIRGRDYVGGLVGWNRGTVTGCSVDGHVVGFSQVGGLVGVNCGEINTCSSTGTVSSQQDMAGGLVGNNSPIVSNIIGPLLSGNGWAGISKSFSSAYVTGERNVGGLVGWGNGTIANCYSSGTVTGQDAVGGLIGGGGGGRFKFCYSTARVMGDMNTGGLVGTKGYSIEAFCVWDANMSGIGTSAAGKGKTTVEMMSSETYYCWGADDNWMLDEGNDYPHLTWENRGGRPISEYDRRYGGGSGDANDPYRIWTPQQFITVGWYEEDCDKHFLLMTDLDSNDISSTEIRPIGNAEAPFTGVFDGQGYAISHIKLSLFSHHVGVFGVVGIRIPDGLMRGPAPYRISGVDAPGFILNLQVSDAHLTGLDMQGVLAGFNVNGTVSGCSVTGSVGGGSSTWSRDVLGGLVGRNMGLIDKCRASCYVKGEYFVGGLVGSNYGTIQSSYSTGEAIGSGLHIGGLTGDNSGNISDCCSQCFVRGGGQVGGLVGSNFNGGEIINCSSTGDVSGEQHIGGLVGLNLSGVTNSYSTGSISGGVNAGGLVGSNGDSTIQFSPHPGRISNCYSTGSVSGISSVGGLVGLYVLGSVTSCFWDMETSGQVTSGGGTGKTTAEMQMASIFTDAGWDFVGESENGTEDIWSICEGTNYPRLVWQIPAVDFVCPDGITIEDFVFFIEHWWDDNCDLSNDYCQGTDLDFSGTVDEADLEILVDNWLAEVRSD